MRISFALSCPLVTKNEQWFFVQTLSIKTKEHKKKKLKSLSGFLLLKELIFKHSTIIE
jgi:hypothetical protein